MQGDVLLDGGGEFRDAREHATLQAIGGEASEKRSTMFSHEAEVGVKWTWTRGCFSSHA